MDTYKATNTLNGKFYIGSAIDFERRKKEHLRSKEKYPFQNALRKHPEVFIWEVWSDNSDEPTLEQALLDMWYGKEQCYNLSPVAGRPMSGRKHSEHSKQKIRKALLGRSHTEETKEKFRQVRKENPSFRGRNHTEKTKQKMRDSALGRTSPMLGRKHGEEAREKMRAAAKNRPLALSPSMLGKKHSEESKDKIRLAKLGSRNASFGKRWWVNCDGETQYCYENPGAEWKNGRKWRKG
jgi:group I intron endonuclease